MLSNDQVEYIRKVLQKRGIETLDLLEEMTDHFVQAIEEREGDIKKLTLREVLRHEVAKFGPFGMMKLQEEYQIKLEKQGQRILWNTFKTFWKIPQIIASVSFFYVLFLAIQAYQGQAVDLLKNILFVNAIIYFAVLIYYRYYLGTNKLAMYAKLYASVYWINLPVISSMGTIFNSSNPERLLTFQSQLIATALLGVMLLFQIAAGIILLKSFAAIKEQRLAKA